MSMAGSSLMFSGSCSTRDGEPAELAAALPEPICLLASGPTPLRYDLRRTALEHAAGLV
jgi:hypothetical protein